MKRRSDKLLRLVMLIGAFCFLALQINALKSAWYLHEHGIRAEAKILALRGKTFAPKAGTSYCYAMSVGGREIEVVLRSDLTIGKSYPVIYSPVLTSDLVIAPVEASIFELYRLRLSEGWVGWVVLALFPVTTWFSFWFAWHGFPARSRA